MDIPLVLTSPKPNRLVYSFPLWFRFVLSAILFIVIAALFTGAETPGYIAWTVLVILLLSALYEDKWVFDAAKGEVKHRAGLLIAARSWRIDFSEIARFRIVPFVKGTIPGSEEEKKENEAALSGGRSDDGTPRRHRHKKPFLHFEIECADGSRYLIDRLPGRRIEKLRNLASRIADHCGKTVSEKQS